MCLVSPAGVLSSLEIVLVLYKAMYFLGNLGIVLARTKRTSFSSLLLQHFKLLYAYF